MINKIVVAAMISFTSMGAFAQTLPKEWTKDFVKKLHEMKADKIKAKCEVHAAIDTWKTSR